MSVAVETKYKTFLNEEYTILKYKDAYARVNQGVLTIQNRLQEWQVQNVEEAVEIFIEQLKYGH